MTDIVRLALSARVANRPGIRQIALGGAAVVLATGCVTAALGCALAALWLYALPYAGPAGAPLVVAGVLLALAIAILLAARFAMRPAKPVSGLQTGLLLTQATQVMKEQKGSVLLAALLAGFAAGSARK